MKTLSVGEPYLPLKALFDLAEYVGARALIGSPRVEVGNRPAPAIQSVDGHAPSRFAISRLAQFGQQPPLQVAPPHRDHGYLSRVATVA